MLTWYPKDSILLSVIVPTRFHCNDVGADVGNCVVGEIEGDNVGGGGTQGSERLLKKTPNPTLTTTAASTIMPQVI
jgi:hypothetical protein